MSPDDFDLSHGDSNGEASPLKSTVAVNDDNEESVSGQAKTKDFFLLARSNRWKAAISSMKHPGASPNLVVWLYGLLSSGYFPLCSVGVLFHLEKLHIDAKWAKAAVRASKLQKPMISWADFERNQMSKQDFPLATSTVIVLCILLHVCRVILWGDHWRPSAEADPLFNLLAQTDHGDSDEGPEFYRFFTAIFLHSSNTQLYRAMFGLWVYGTKMEHVHGPLFIVYMLCLAGAVSITTSVLIGSGSCGGMIEVLCCIRGAITINWAYNYDIILLEANEEKENTVFKFYFAPMLYALDHAAMVLDLKLILVSDAACVKTLLASFFGVTLSWPFASVSYKGIKLPLGEKQDLLDKKFERETWLLFMAVSLLLFCVLSYAVAPVTNGVRLLRLLS